MCVFALSMFACVLGLFFSVRFFVHDDLVLFESFEPSGQSELNTDVSPVSDRSDATCLSQLRFCPRKMGQELCQHERAQLFVQSLLIRRVLSRFEVVHKLRWIMDTLCVLRG